MYTINERYIGGDIMCTKNQLNIISNSIADEAKRILDKKLDAVVLYGSYARGDYDNESDIDIMIRINCPLDLLRDYEHLLVDFSSELSLENDVTVSLVVVDSQTYNKYKNFYPFYKNVEMEGIKIA